MSITKHRIAAYLPSDIDEKFQAFKKGRGIGDSQALILILTEFLGASHQVSCSNSLDIESLKSELLSELLRELDFRFGELKSELSSKSLMSIETTHESLKDVDVNHDSFVDVKVDCEVIAQQTISELSKRFGCDPSLVRKQKSKYKNEPEKFITWSKSRDPDGRGWRFDEEVRLFAPANG